MSRPNKFVNLHGHTNKSIYDGFGSADEHIDFALQNGADAIAFTDHGNMNYFPEQEQKTRELHNKGINFKTIPGVEFYYHPDLQQWSASKATADQKRKEESEAAKLKPITDEDDPGVSVEDEDASKQIDKFLDPVKRRHHLVVLPKSRKGLENIFRLVSRSNREGYYRFPRIDAKMLKEHGEDLIVSTACISGNALIETDCGTMSLLDLINNLNKGMPLNVLSYDEINKKLCWQQVISGQCTRKSAKVIKIKTKSGKVLKLTSDHRVLTDKGWIYAGQLIIGYHKILSN